MQDRAIGLIELTSIAAGFLVADTMLKSSNVQLLLSRSICSGKYMVLIGGDVAAVGAAVHAGCTAAKGCLIDQFVIPNVHPDVFAALSTLKGAKGRLDHVATARCGAPIFVDYAHTPDALEKVSVALKAMGFARLITVFGCGGDRDATKRPLMGRAVARSAACSFADFPSRNDRIASGDLAE